MLFSSSTQRTYRPQLEVLEDRSCLSTLVASPVIGPVAPVNDKRAKRIDAQDVPVRMAYKGNGARTEQAAHGSEAVSVEARDALFANPRLLNV